MHTSSSDRILVTGAGGFIGRRLVTALLQRGCRVRCMVRRPVELPQGVEQTQADLVPIRLTTFDEAIQTALAEQTQGGPP